MNAKLIISTVFLILLSSTAVNAEDRALTWNFQSDSGIWTVALADDGRGAVAGGYDNYVYFFNKAGDLLWKHKALDTVWTVAISKKGEYIVAGSKDKTIYFFNRGGSLLWKYKTGDTVWTVDISQDGEYVVAGSYDNNIYFFDKTGKLLWKYKALDIVLSTSISADGEHIVAGSYDNNIYFFDKTGKLLWKFAAKDEIWAVAVSGDGRYVVVGSRDNTVYFLNSLGQLLSKHMAKYFVSSVATSFDGTYAVGGSYDNNIYFFERALTPPPTSQFPKITALKTIMSNTLVEGETTTVEITLQNIGDQVAKNIRLKDSIPLGFQLVEGETTWAGELAPQGVETLSYKIMALEVPDNKEAAYQLPGVDIIYEDPKGVVFTLKGATILVTVKPEISEPKWSAYIRENAIVLLIIFLLLILFLLTRRRRRELRMEKVEILKHIKGEIGSGARTEGLLVKRKKPSAPGFDFRYKKYREETLNLIKVIKAELQGKRPLGVGTFPRRPKRAFYLSLLYWVRSFGSGSENRAYRERNVTLLTYIKKAVGG